MLPFAARRSRERVGRAWFGNDQDAFPSVAETAPKLERAGRQQRNSDDPTEYVFVSVPADRRAGCIFGHQSLGSGKKVGIGNFGKIWFIENQKTVRRGAVDQGFFQTNRSLHEHQFLRPPDGSNSVRGSESGLRSLGLHRYDSRPGPRTQMIAGRNPCFEGF